MPDNQNSIKKLKELFPYSFPKIDSSNKKGENVQLNKIFMMVTKQHLILQVDKDINAIKFLRTIKQCHRDVNNKR